MLGVEEFDEDLVEQLRSRARDVLLTKAIALEEKIDMAEPSKDLLEMEGMDEHTARVLASPGIKTMEELPERLLTQLVSAGVSGKGVDDSLTDEEKMTLLGYLRTHHGGGEGGTTKITLKQKSVSQIKQATRTGPARTVQVEVRKKRTFVKRSTIEEEVAAAR